MKYLKSLPMGLLCAYTSFMFYRGPNISDALIVISLTVLYGFEFYMDKRYQEVGGESKEELERLREELRKEQLELQIQGIRTQKALDMNKRAAKDLGDQNETKKFIF